MGDLASEEPDLLLEGDAIVFHHNPSRLCGGAGRHTQL